MKENFGFGKWHVSTNQRGQLLTGVRKLLITLAVILTVSATAFPVFANEMQSPAAQTNTGPFLTGWWENVSGGTSLVANYAAQGERFFLLDGGYCSTSQLGTVKAFLDEANKYGMKVIVKLTCKDHTSSGISTADFTTTINSLKAYPALYAWGLGDEPEFSSDAAVRTQRHDAIVPYYKLVKQLDTHPVFISHDYNAICCDHDWVTQFLDVEDLVGMHAYPFYATKQVFAGTGKMYDRWASVMKIVANYNAAHGTNKQFFSATMQGFGAGTSTWRNPTYEELMHETFSAVVQGVPSIMFWMDQWGQQAGMIPMVGQVMGQIQAVGPQMRNGRTSDPSIQVSVTDRNQLAYRFGTDGTTSAILAVNIANRDSSSGLTLSNVKFTLPSTVRVSQVTVVGENRALAVASDNSFTDTFKPFAVHIYKLAASAGPLPTATKTTVPTATPVNTNVPPATATPVTTAAPPATATPKGTVAPTATATFQSPQDTIAPNLSITNPVNNSLVKVSTKVTLSANATDNAQVYEVAFWVNSKLVCAVKAAPYTCGWAVPSTVGTTYTILVKAYDTNSNSTSAKVTVKSAQ